MSKRIWKLTGEVAKKAACREILAAQEGMVVTLAEPTRNLDQSAKFYAIWRYCQTKAICRTDEKARAMESFTCLRPRYRHKTRERNGSWARGRMVQFARINGTDEHKAHGELDRIRLGLLRTERNQAVSV